jgi:Tfp pilus assembly protein PilV
VKTSKTANRRGITLVETLAAALIVSIAVGGAVSLYTSMLTLTKNTRDATTGAQLARHTTENIRMDGFTNAVDGTSTLYYGSAGTLSSASTTRSGTSYYSVTTTISTDKTQTSTTGTRIAPLALRTVTITVRRLTDNSVLETWGSYLARGGV